MKLNKLILTSSLLLFFTFAQAQLIMIDGETGEYQYDEVVAVEGVSKSQIIERASQWMKAYYDVNQKITTDSIGTSTLATFQFSWKFIQKKIPLELFYDITVKAKDNRYKYTFSNFRIGKTVNENIDAYPLKTYIARFPTKYQINIEEPVDEEITKAILSLQFFVENGKFQDDKDDW